MTDDEADGIIVKSRCVHPRKSSWRCSGERTASAVEDGDPIPVQPDQ
jgi:hypothetical protein